jgi:uncharacterized protein with von Willebrand factor type A (vWA) domain
MSEIGIRKIERSLDYIKDVPEEFLEFVLCSLGHTPELRAESILAWRAALLEGRLPAKNAVKWPIGEANTAIRSTIEALNILPFCKDQPEIVDSLLHNLLEAGESAGQRYAQLVKELEELARVKRVEVEELARVWRVSADEVAKSAGKKRGKGNAGGQSEGLDEAELERGWQDAWTAASAGAQEEWKEKVRVWSALSEVFDDLRMATGLGWDLARTTLRHVGWQRLEQLRALLERADQLKAIIRELGKLQITEEEDLNSPAHSIFETLRTTERTWEEVYTPLVPAETRGIRRSGDLGRMLPVEAALLNNPTLRLLWHARRAEHALLTYLVEGVERQEVVQEVERQHERREPQKKLERGPIMICLDTSGSMAGLPESVAKALTLEAAKTAHRQNRRCYLYAFSGPGDVAELELSMDSDGLPRLLQFLSMSFHGGTDINAPLIRATQRLAQHEEWRAADLLLATDGEFPESREMVKLLNEHREKYKLQVQGVLIGNTQSVALKSLCDKHKLHILHRWDILNNTASKLK